MVSGHNCGYKLHKFWCLQFTCSPISTLIQSWLLKVQKPTGTQKFDAQLHSLNWPTAKDLHNYRENISGGVSCVSIRHAECRRFEWWQAWRQLFWHRERFHVIHIENGDSSPRRHNDKTVSHCVWTDAVMLPITDIKFWNDWIQH